MNDIIYYLWLVNALGEGNKKANILVKEVTNPYTIYKMPKDDYRHNFSVPLLPKEIEALSNKDLTFAFEIISFCNKKNVRILTIDDERYPRQLQNLYNPPIVLYTFGDLECIDANISITVVGSRKATREGLDIAKAISQNLAACGVTIISGLARGIDTNAHIGALEAGGKTVAVLGCGINVVFPKENRRLMEQIYKNGCIITEFPPNSEPLAWHFPLRNRIVAALSRGTIVVEAGERSGSLITASLALNLGKDVFAVPGPGSKENCGCNALVRDGAKPITNALEVLEEYADILIPKDLRITLLENILGQTAAEKPRQTKQNVQTITPPETLSGDSLNIFRLLINGQKSLESIAIELDLAPSTVSIALTLMEIDGYIECLPGQHFKII